MFWMALMASLLVQDAPDDLRKEIEKLKKQTVELQERLGLLEQSAVEDAQTIQRLRQIVKLLESNVPAEPASPSPTGALARLSRRTASPPARAIAPATPPPCISCVLAALAIASTSSWVMSASRTSTEVDTAGAARRPRPAPLCPPVDRARAARPR